MATGGQTRPPRNPQGVYLGFKAEARQGVAKRASANPCGFLSRLSTWPKRVAARCQFDSRYAIPGWHYAAWTYQKMECWSSCETLARQSRMECLRSEVPRKWRQDRGSLRDHQSKVDWQTQFLCVFPMSMIAAWAVEEIKDRPLRARVEVIPEPLKARIITKGEALAYYAAMPLQKDSWRSLVAKEEFSLIGEPLREEHLISIELPESPVRSELCFPLVGDSEPHSFPLTSLLCPMSGSARRVESTSASILKWSPYPLVPRRSPWRYKVIYPIQVWGRALGPTRKVSFDLFTTVSGSLTDWVPRSLSHFWSRSLLYGLICSCTCCSNSIASGITLTVIISFRRMSIHEKWIFHFPRQMLATE